MRQTTKKLLLVGGVSLALATGYINYKWFAHKVDNIGTPAQKVEEKLIAQKVPVKIDAATEKPKDGGSKLDAKPKKNNLDWGHPTGIPYRKSEAEKRVEKVQQTP